MRPPRKVLGHKDIDQLGARGIGIRAGDIFRAMATPTGEAFATGTYEREGQQFLSAFHQPLDYGTGQIVNLSCIMLIERDASHFRKK